MEGGSRSICIWANELRVTGLPSQMAGRQIALINAKIA